MSARPDSRLCPDHFVGAEHLRCATCGSTDPNPPTLLDLEPTIVVLRSDEDEEPPPLTLGPRAASLADRIPRRPPSPFTGDEEPF